MMFIGTPAYPKLLASLETAPPVISARGGIGLLDRPAVAIVGARNVSAAGARFARRLATDLAAEEMEVASGLARGIDAAAHQGAMAGGTIAVVAGGLDIVYPPENAGLMSEIAKKGPDHRRTKARHRATGPPFPAPQPHHRRAGGGDTGGEGRAEIGIADHGTGGCRSWPRGHGGARLAARSTGARLQPADSRGHHAGAICG